MTTNDTDNLCNDTNDIEKRTRPTQSPLVPSLTDLCKGFDNLSPELLAGLRAYADRVAALGGYGARVRARTQGSRGQWVVGVLVERGPGCQPGVRTADGRVYAVTLDGAEAEVSP